jgi:hypothetical protein
MNDMLQQQLKNIKGVVLPNDTSAIVRDTTFKPPK